MRRLSFFLLGLGPVAVLLLGCGKAEYEAVMQARVGQLAFASNFIENLHGNTTDVIKGVASLRLPTFIDDEATTLQQGSRTSRGPVSPQRMQPPFVNLPGYRFCYEKFVDLGGRNNTQPVYCYFGAVPTSEKKQAAILAEIKRGVASKFKGAVWQDVNLDTPDGGKLAFKKMSVKGTQTFELDPIGGEVKQLPGQFDVYVHSATDFHVVVAFRATNESSARTGVFEKAPFALGTLVVEAADDAAGQNS